MAYNFNELAEKQSENNVSFLNAVKTIPIKNFNLEDSINKLNQISKELNEEFVEREKEIKMLLLAIVSGSNVFLHGVPGTAKSQLVEELVHRINDNNYFRILMSKTTDPSEIFGTVSLNSLKKDIYKYNTENKLPTAHFAFIDECYKSSSVILNGLLTIMNEHLFFNDKQEECPLITLIGASNEFPEEEELEALHDRFLLRWHVKNVASLDNRIKMFKNYLAKDNKAIKHTTIGLNEILALNKEYKKIKVPDAILNEYNNIFVKLELNDITFSDRRKNEGLKILQADALLNKQNKVTFNNFDSLIYVLWNDLQDIEIVKEVLQDIVCPQQKTYDVLFKAYTEMQEEYVNFANSLQTSENDTENDINFAAFVTEKLNEISYAIDKLNLCLVELTDTETELYKNITKLKDKYEKFRDEKLTTMV